MTLITFQDGQPVMRDGKVGTEQECCCDQTCQCSNPMPSNLAPTASIELVLPDVPFDCPSGTFTAEIPLALSFGFYQGCVDIDLGGGITGQLEAGLICDLLNGEQRYLSYAVFRAWPCNGTPYQCTIGNGGFIGFGFDEYLVHDSVIVDGVCKPKAASRSWTALDCVLTLTIGF